MFPHGDVATFYSAGERVVLGQTVPDWTNPTTEIEIRCGVAPAETAEQVEPGRVAATADLRLYLPRTVDIDPAWRCSVRGRTWEVVGRSSQWRHPMTGWTPGTTVDLREVEG